MSRLSLIPLFLFFAHGPTAALAQDYEAYYLNNRQFYPLGETNWSDDAQGVAHDDGNWFITTTHSMWKIPVERDLDSVSSSSPGVVHRELAFNQYPEIVIAGYHHLGDPVVYRACDADFLLVPMEGPDIPSALGVFRCADLTYVDHVTFPPQCDAQGQFCHDAGWVAVDFAGRLYTSRQHANSLLTYDFNWLHLCTDNEALITFAGEIPLFNEQNDPLDLATMQGGEFAPGDKLLYLVSGFYNDDDGLEEREGIHVIDTLTWKRVAHSTRGFGFFDYYYDPGFETYEEPEGLTIWDLDGGQAPGIRGQLHVFVSDNDSLPHPLPPGDSGDIDFKHYTNIIRVEANAPCALAACCIPNPPPGCFTPFNETCEFGIPSCPFRTLGSAVNLAWDGSELRIKSGTYLEPTTISRKVRLRAEGGMVRIGG